MNAIATRVTVQLDRIESTLPAVPARLFHLQRSIAGAAYDRTASVVDAVSESARNLIGTARTSGKTVTGQARAAAKDVATTTRTSAKTVTGQAGAQGRRVADAASKETTKLLDDAIDAVEGDVEAAQDAVDERTETKPGRGRPYEQWTKAELLDRAKELDVEGRTQMNKPELIAALRS